MEWELLQDTRYEYVNGEVYAMTGGTLPHSEIAGNLIALFARYPSLIALVLSPTTEAYDQGGKFAQYRRLETLKEYVLISSDSLCVEIFRLNEKGKWELTPYTEGDEIHLTSVDLTFPIKLLYEDITVISEATPESDRAY